jgi:Kef-type K+ transport system membrane component KefB
VFIGTAFSITAFPVLARILKETSLIYSRPGALVMGAAAINDAVAWCLLILAISIASAGDMANAGYVFLAVIAFALGLFFLVRPALEYAVAYTEDWMHQLQNKGNATGARAIGGNMFALIICMLLICSWTTALLGVHAIFGAFLFGLIIPRGTQLFHDLNEYIENYILTILLPLYFAYSGINTDVTKINDGKTGSMVVLVCFVATISKFVGCGGVALIQGIGFRESSVIAVLMNTRGLVEIIVLNLGRSFEILNEKVFAVMIIMCLVTTFLTCPLIELIFPLHIRGQFLTDERTETVTVVKCAANPEEGSEDVNLEFRQIFNGDYDVSNVLVVVDKLTHIEMTLSIVHLFGNPQKDNKLNVTVTQFVEPSCTTKDPFIGYDSKGRLLFTRMEATTFLPVSSEISPLMPVTIVSRTIGAEKVNAFKVSGDPNEFYSILKEHAELYMSNIVIIPWRKSEYFDKLFWKTQQETVLPLALLVDINETDETDEIDAERANKVAKVVNTILILISGSEGDAVALGLAMRFAASKLHLKVTVVIPRKKRTFSSHLHEKLKTYKQLALSIENLVYIKGDFDFDNMQVCLSSILSHVCSVP